MSLAIPLQARGERASQVLPSVNVSRPSFTSWLVCAFS